MKKLFTSLFTFIVTAAFAQERLTPLSFNPVLFNQSGQTNGFRDIAESRDTLCLPFFDDFSNLHVFLDSVNSSCGDTVYNVNASFVYPNSLFWMDSSAYINKNYPILPPSYGTATLDGLNMNGRPYNVLLSYGAADTLTSKPIYMSGALTGSVYLSFDYQPGGFGDFPETTDSLILEFRNADSSWTHIWSTTNQDGDVNQAFKTAIFQVEDVFLYDGFQFRFRNYASIYGNNDHWNIDYVYLNDTRSAADTIFRDVSFTTVPSSYLKRYRQMPWQQFRDHQAEEINDQVFIQMVNNFNDIVNTAHSYTAYEKYSGDEIVPLTSPISENFAADSYLFNTYDNFTIPSATTGYSEDSLTVEFKYILDPSSDVRRINDTLYHDVAFYNYYAYDDGTAEKAYGLNGIGAELAMHFHANEPDTLKEVYVHWAYVDGSNSDLFFSLVVWNSIDTNLLSGDEDIAYQADFLVPKYVDSINGFYVYTLTDFLGNPTPVPVNGDFYVGWLQTQSDLLNVGFDVNNDASSNVYFNVGGTWERSILPGAIMIRPRVGGDYSKYTGISELPLKAEALLVYPNPAGDHINVSAGYESGNYTIYNYAGEMIKGGQLSGNSINTKDLISGFYILRITDERTGQSRTARFMKQ